MLELDSVWPWQVTAGVDEAGRGPLFGPVAAAAVVLDPQRPIPGLNDSKQLRRERREQLDEQIREGALAWQVAWCTVQEIDQHNILAASHLAMLRALAGLQYEVQQVLIDGNRLPRDGRWTMQAVVKGDSRHSAIAAASVLAKVARDHRLQELARQYPGYGLERNMGYPTAEHRQALAALGPTPEHRRSYAPVRAALADQSPRQLEL